MKGVIIIPTFYKERHLDPRGWSKRSWYLFERINRMYGFPLIYTDNPAPYLKGQDVGLIYAVPYHNRPEIPPGLIQSKCKLIGYFEDLQCWGDSICKKNKELMFGRYDVLIGGHYKSFREWYPQYLHKYIHFPVCYFPYEKYADLTQIKLGLSHSKLFRPKMLCLLSGTSNPKTYPFRNYIRKQDPTGLVKYTGKSVLFDDYPAHLNEHFSAVSVSGRYNNLVAKYLEIPAAGTLMLAQEIEELKVLGLKANEHYVPITYKNVFKQINKVLRHPNEYIEMRNKATKLVREKHSDINRAKQFQDILDRVS